MMKITKTGWLRSTGYLCAILLVAGAATAATVNSWEMPPRDQYGGVTFTEGSDGSITMTFPDSSPMQPRTAYVVAGFGPVPADYSDMAKIAFKFVGDGHTPKAGTATIELRGSNGRLWTYRFEAPTADGEVKVIEAPLASRDGWTRNDTGDLDAKFAQDVESCGIIAVRIAQGGAEEQSYGISSFSMFNSAGESLPATLSPLAASLWSRFRAQSADALSDDELALDADGDGMTDLEELVAGTDADDGLSIFAAEIVASDATGTTIKWPCADEATVYTVYRAGSVDGAFAPVGVDMPGAAAVAAGEMKYLDPGATGGPYFYKIVASKE